MQPRNKNNPSTTSDCSRTSNGVASVQQDGTCMNEPVSVPPQWAMKSRFRALCSSILDLASFVEIANRSYIRQFKLRFSVHPNEATVATR